jgi:hypothetical protein
MHKDDYGYSVYIMTGFEFMYIIMLILFALQ